MQTAAGFSLPSCAVRSVVLAGGLLSLGLAPLHAQNASITGRVLSAHSGEPVAGAEIRLEGSRRGAVTSENGLFRISKLPPGEHVFTIQYLGAKSERFRVNLGPGEALDVAFDLEMKVIPVPELEVSVNEEIPVGKLYSFYRRAERGPGHYITREEIEEHNTSRTTDLLRQVPGVDVGATRLDGATVTMNRREGCVPTYYVDGAYTGYFDIDNLPPRDIAGIEVYSGNSQVPAEFKHADRCGVIAIWTRDPSNWRGFQ